MACGLFTTSAGTAPPSFRTSSVGRGRGVTRKSSAPDVRDDVLADRATLAGFDRVHAEDRIPGREHALEVALAGDENLARLPVEGHVLEHVPRLACGRRSEERRVG